MLENHRIVPKEEWLAERKQLLAEEKEFTRLRDQISQERRELPWVKIEKSYEFGGSDEIETLAELFAGKSQLIVYHFMFGPDWEVGCKSCSFWADNFNGINSHLRHRDTSFVAISRAAYSKLEAYKNRTGWDFKWVSSFGNDFNYDFHVSFTNEQMASEAYYNYELRKPWGSEAVGISVFYQDDEGNISTLIPVIHGA